jgi:hypothetical protein
MRKRFIGHLSLSIDHLAFKKLHGPIFLALIMAGSSFAQRPFFFEEARPLALGGAYTGLAADASALFYNPAGLSQLRGSIASLSGSYQSYRWDGTPGRFDQYGGTFLVAKPNAGIGVSLLKRGDSKDDIWRFPAPGDSLGPYSLLNQEMIFVVGASQALSEGGAIGLAGRYTRTTAPAWGLPGEVEKKDGLALDLGALLPISKGTQVGVSALNVLTRKSDYLMYDDLGNVRIFGKAPVAINVGASIRATPEILFVLEGSNLWKQKLTEKLTGETFNTQPVWRFGQETVLPESLRLRLGVSRTKAPVVFAPSGPQSYVSRNTYSAGLGYLGEAFVLDFAIAMDERERDMPVKPTSTLRYVLTLMRRM